MTTPVPFDDRDGDIWFNGELTPWRDAKVHSLNHGLHYASSVFEGERAYDGEIFKLREHTERLFFSAETMDMTIPYTVEQIDQACRDVLAANNLTDAYVRPFAWRGSESMNVSAQNATIHVAVAVWPWPTLFSQEQRMAGVRLGVAKWKRPSPDTIPARTKAAGLYMICTLSKHQAMAEGYDDAIMVDWRDYVAEATGANVFFVKDGALHTPIPDCILDGITRRTVIELARARGIDTIGRRITLDELDAFDECFLTGTAAEVTPVASIGEATFPGRELSGVLLADYMKLVRRG